MIKQKIRFSIIILLLIVPATKLSASGLGLKLVGARAFSLGGAFRGVANDFSAAYWNPAGMTRLNGFQLGFGAVGVRPLATITPKNLTPDVFNPNPADGGLYGLNNGYTIGETSLTKKTHLIPSFAFGYHSEGSNIAYGLSFSIPFGLGTNWDLFNLEQVNNYGNSFSSQYPKFDTESDIAILAIQPTVAYEFSEQLSVGVGFIYTIANKLSFRQPSFSNNPTLGTPFGTYQYPYLITDTILDGTGTGFGLNFGVMLEASEQLSIGVDVQYFTDIDVDGEVTATTYFPFNKDKFEFISGLLADPSLDDATKALYTAAAGVYSGATLVNTSNAATTTVPLPLEIGVGIGYQVNEKLLIAADFMFTQWSAWDEIPININKDFDGDGVNDVTTLVEHWDDVNKYSIGLEYLIMDSDDRLTFLRLGFTSDGSPIPDETLGAFIPDIGTKNSVFVGLGLNMGKITIDLAAQTMFVDDRTINKVSLFNGDPTDQTNLPGNWSLEESALVAGLAYSF
ncbi:MAG: outer membrane protein transport protein [Candidatus Marinimicrobia bacterium]|nr:outer membrane protein transport protein [Candidatus Neomarinimicrobiota bacterium]